MSAPEEPGVDVALDPPAVRTSSKSALVRYDLTPWDAAAAILALLMLVIFVPALTFPHWTPMLALGFAVLPLGVGVVAARCRQRHVAAMWLAGASVWIIAAALASGSIRSSLLGFAGRDLSALSLITCLMLWAVGSMVTDRGRAIVLQVVVWSAAVMAVLGIMQVVADIESGPIGMRFDRARGIYANPVYFGAICASAAIIAIGLYADRARPRMIAAVGVLSAAVVLSGSRVAAGALLVLGVLHLVTHRSRRGVVGFGAVVAGLVAGTMIDRLLGGGRNAADRLADRSSGGRIDIWRYGIEAWLERPLIGQGPGLFRPSVQGRWTLPFTRDAAYDELVQAWFDPHNALVHLLVMGGVGIVILLGGWVISWWWSSARGPALWGVGVLVLTMGLQPMHLLTMSIGCLLFGVAGATRSPSVALPGRWVTASLAVLGLALSSWVLAADIVVSHAVAQYDEEQLGWASTLYLGDPVVNDLVAQLYFLDENQAGELEWRERSASAEPDRPYWWTQLARAQLSAGDIAGAEASVARALELQPFNYRAIRVDFGIALELRDVDRLGRDLDLLCQLELAECDLDPAEVLEQLRGPSPAGAQPG